MRTYWLTGEDDSRIRMRSQQETTNTPDLLCRKTSPVPVKTKSDVVLNASINRFQTFVQQRLLNTTELFNTDQDKYAQHISSDICSG